MTRILKRCGWMLLMAAGFQSASAFSLWGTKEAYMQDVLGYNLLQEFDYQEVSWFVFSTPDTLAAPHNLGEEYRWAIPLMYYTYDPSFLDYFGSNGVAEVDSAFGILNALTNISAYSTDLSEFPQDESRVNYTARDLHLFDLKSAALELLVNRLGLADPERWTWNIRSRDGPFPSCPFYSYDIFQRNFDPVTWEPSKYVNGNLFTYVVNQHCPPDVRGDRVDAEELLVDPERDYQTAVASPKISRSIIHYLGMFHVGLTRDDVGGLRYLYRTNNLNVEASAPDAVLFQTNNLSQLLYTSNLTLFAIQALTNNAAGLTALYPDLVITDTTNTFTNVFTTNVTAFFTNYPWQPVDSPAQLAFSTNVTAAVQTLFHHTFANVITFQFVSNKWVTAPLTQIPPATNLVVVTSQIITVAITNPPWTPAGTFIIQTNTSNVNFQTNLVAGDFFILNSNLCDIAIISAQLTNVIPITNLITTATNQNPGSNAASVLSYTQNEIDYFSNHVFIIYPVFCVTNAIALRQGLDKISFVRHDFDSLLNRFFYPITNYYKMMAVTNNTLFVQQFRRIVTRPDILIAAQDLPTGPEVQTVDNFFSFPALNISNSIPGLAGPGTIEGAFTLTFNKGGPVRLNSSPFFITEQSSILYYKWASFDGSTNAPLIYPSGTSIADLENSVLIQVSPPSLPAGKVGTNYSVALSVTGGQAPYSWMLGPGSPSLPPGLNLTQDPGDSSRASISGVPAQAGTFDFWIRLTDAGSRFIDQFYAVAVNP